MNIGMVCYASVGGSGVVATELLVIFGCFQFDATRNAAWIGLCSIGIAVILYAACFRRVSR